MNRAERRRWQKNALRFARACGGVAENYIIPAEARAKISVAALSENRPTLRLPWRWQCGRTPR